MRIAIVNTLYFPEHVGGAELSVRTIAEGLAKMDHDVMVLTLCRDHQASRDSLNGVEIIRIPIPNIYWPFSMERDRNRNPVSKALWHAVDSYNPISPGTVNKVLKNFAPDIVQTHNLTGFSTTIWPAIRKLGAPLIHILRDYSLLCPKVSMTRNGASCGGTCRLCQIARYPRRAASSVVDAVIGISEFTLKSHLNAGFFPNAVLKEVIHNGYDLPLDARQTSRPRSANHPLHIGFLGTIAPHKGIHVLLTAVSRLPRDQVSLIIGGEGVPAYVSCLRTEFPQPNIHFCGKVQPGDFFTGLDLLVVPSIWNEPFGRVVIEAFAHGLPVLGTRVGGIPEIIEEGVSGRLIPPNDALSLERALRKAIEEPQTVRFQGVAAKSKAEKFQSQVTVGAYDSLHRRILSLASK